LAKPAAVVLNYERIDHWVKVGAQMSDRVSFLVKHNPAPAAQPVA
jgi:ribosomal protein S16